MHPFEQLMADALERGEQPNLGLFGGSSALLEAVHDIGVSPLMPEFIRLVLASTPDNLEGQHEVLGEFICQCIEIASEDFAMAEAIDLLDEARPLSDEVDERCFAGFLRLAGDRNARPIARAVALDGALRWAFPNRRFQLRVLDYLLGIGYDDSPIFLSRAAKIMGVAYSHWREDGLLERLLRLSDVEGAADEASFELGMAKLANGLETEDPKRAEEAFSTAKYWFARSSDRREQRPDAVAYVHCLDILLAFSRGEESPRLEELVSSLSSRAFEMQAWHSNPGVPPWLGARHLEAYCWHTLATTLTGLAEYLKKASWWEPGVVIRDYVIVCYTASRSILKRSLDGGIETIIRPRIEGALTRSEGLAHHLKDWLRRNVGDEWKDEANILSQKIDDLVEKGFPHPPEAAAPWPKVAALLEEANISKNLKEVVLAAITHAFAVHISNLPDSAIALIEECLNAVTESPDYINNRNGRSLFDTVLLWTIAFLCARLELTKGVDPDIGYLFERSDGSLPHEDELQRDYFKFMFSNAAGTEIEVSNIAGGRADVRFIYNGEKMVTETKREDEDCSFEALQRYYSGQTTDYQNVSVRLGFLLVLDQTKRLTEGTPHIRTMVKATPILRTGESDPRWVVMVKIPGRRLRPSDLTKEAKKTE